MSASPAYRYESATPLISNTVDLPTTARALFIGGSGNVVLRAPGSATDVTFSNLGSGTILPVSAARIMSTGTTASAIVILY